MSKSRLFIDNMLVYGFGGIISKIIPFIMLPIVTRLMPETFYLGLNDLVSTITSFAAAFAVMGMYDAMFRMFFEKEDKAFKQSVCSTALAFVCCMALLVFVFLVVFQSSIGQFFFEDVQYSYLVCFSAFAVVVNATTSIISAPTRMQNQRRIFLTTNIIGAFLSYAIVIPLLLREYYVIAIPLAGIVSGIVLDVSFYFFNRHWFLLCSVDLSLLKQLLVLAIPLMPTFLIYWIFNSCDRVMIAQYLDVSAVGIYAVGAKLGAVSQLIYTAFAGGWTYFAFSTMKEEKQVESNSMIHEYLGAISFLVSIWVCGIARPLVAWLFPEDYQSGFVVVPYLFLAPLFLMLFQVACTQFYVIKKTAWVSLILFFGAFVNIFLNYILIPSLGIEGAAIATLLGYAVSDFICVVVLSRKSLMVISVRSILIFGVTVLYFILWRFLLYEKGLIFSFCVPFLISIWIIFLYKHELMVIVDRAKKVFKEKCSQA